MAHSKEQILQELRLRWEGILEESDDLDIDINLLTLDGTPGQPLAYDIVQRQVNETFTYTWVETPAAVEAALGLANVSYEQAVETLRNILMEAHAAQDRAPELTQVTSVIKTNGVGMSYGRYHFADQTGSESFPTNYQTYFTTDLLRKLQVQQSGVLFNQLTASLDSADQFALRFGA